MRAIILFIFELSASAGIIYFICAGPTPNKSQEILLPLVLSTLAGDLVRRIQLGWKYISITPKLALLVMQQKPLRISFATLIRIKLDNKYLLVKSNRAPYFQPPGGVLKFYDAGIRQRFHLIDDASYKELKGDEFRLRFKRGRLWHVFNFLKWFDTQKGREIDPHREFYEELIDTNILNLDTFSKPQFSYIKRIIPQITYGKHFKIDELFIFEIFEMILTTNQTTVLKQLEPLQSDEYVFLTAEVIERGGFDAGTDKSTPIGGQTKYIL